MCNSDVQGNLGQSPTGSDDTTTSPAKSTSSTPSTSDQMSESSRSSAPSDSRETHHGPRILDSKLPETQLSMQALKCREMAENAEKAPKIYAMLDIEKKVDTILGNIRKLNKEIHTVNRPSIYTDLKIDELVGEFGDLLGQIETQNMQPPIKPGKEGGGLKRVPADLPKPKVIIVDTEEAVATMVDAILGAFGDDDDGLLLSVDLEAVDLARDGDIAIIQVAAEKLNRVFLVDYYTLGQKSFQTAGKIYKDSTLKHIFESEAIQKFFFDCRRDNDALVHIAGVELAGVIDVQLTYQATRTKPHDRVKLHSLEKAVPYACGLDPGDKRTWLEAKEWGQYAMRIGPEGTAELHRRSCGNSKAINKEHVKETRYLFASHRPICDYIKDYCTIDVVMLPILHRYCMRHPFWSEEWGKLVEEETQKRLDMAKAEVFEEDRGVLKKAPSGWAQVTQVRRVVEEEDKGEINGEDKNENKDDEEDIEDEEMPELEGGGGFEAGAMPEWP